jgi:hypothetical protein
LVRYECTLRKVILKLGAGDFSKIVYHSLTYPSESVNTAWIYFNQIQHSLKTE